MAQERVRGKRGTARRYGLVGWGVGAAALVVVLAAALALGLARGASAPVELERAAPEEAAEEPGADDGEVAEGEASGPLVVHVDGAVAAAGVFELPEGSRVADAVDAAGGLAADADTTTINLAAPVSDGEKVHVPRVGEAAAAPSEAVAGEGGAGALVNLNTAGVDELDELPGIGEATARAIVEDREANGPFSAPEDLMRVSGIGEKKYARLEGMICV